jgi:hypothetical protein
LERRVQRFYRRGAAGKGRLYSQKHTTVNDAVPGARMSGDLATRFAASATAARRCSTNSHSGRRSQKGPSNVAARPLVPARCSIPPTSGASRLPPPNRKPQLTGTASAKASARAMTRDWIKSRVGADEREGTERVTTRTASGQREVRVPRRRKAPLASPCWWGGWSGGDGTRG